MTTLKTYTHKTIEVEVKIADEEGGVSGAHRRGKRQIEEFCAGRKISIVGRVANARNEHNILTVRAMIAVRDE